MPLPFAAALFLNAFLLFWVQPLFTRMALPLLGGAPAVWNTCMVLSQAALLCGYGYGYLDSRLLSPQAQWGLHLAMLLTPLVALLIVPFLLMSTTVPLLQR